MRAKSRSSRARVPLRGIAPVAAAALWVVGAACAEWSPEPPRPDVEGCYDLSLAGLEDVSAPGPPRAVHLTDLPYLPPGSPAPRPGWHPYDARSAWIGYFVYPDTSYQMAWWWEEERENRFGVGNLNAAAAFYIEAVVRGDRLEGELRRWRFDDEGMPIMTEDSYVLPVMARRAACAAPE